jgi:transposase
MAIKRFSQQQKLVILRSAAEMGVKEAAQVAEVHYTSVYEWKRQLEVLGEEGFLAYKSTIPGRGVKEITPKKEEAILTTWNRNRGFGPGQVRNQLRRQGLTVSIGTVRKVMEANGYKAPRKRGGEKEQGHRFESIDRYGKMEEMLTDRGFVFYSWQGANRFERYLELEDIDHIHASAHHPQTLGKIEALNGHLRRELLQEEHFPGVEEADGAISRWIFRYNYERTHQGLGGVLVPGDRFHGLTDLVLSNLGKGMDCNGSPCYPFGKIERSILNLAVDPEGGMALYLLGQPVTLKIGR